MSFKQDLYRMRLEELGYKAVMTGLIRCETCEKEISSNALGRSAHRRSCPRIGHLLKPPLDFAQRQRNEDTAAARPPHRAGVQAGHSGTGEGDVKCEIWCIDCVKREGPRLSAVSRQHGEGFKVVRGDLLVSAICDRCSTPLLAGERVAAVSMWVNETHTPWEHKYIDALPTAAELTGCASSAQPPPNAGSGGPRK